MVFILQIGILIYSGIRVGLLGLIIVFFVFIYIWIFREGFVVFGSFMMEGVVENLWFILCFWSYIEGKYLELISIREQKGEE